MISLENITQKSKELWEKIKADGNYKIIIALCGVVLIIIYISLMVLRSNQTKIGQANVWFPVSANKIYSSPSAEKNKANKLVEEKNLGKLILFTTDQSEESTSVNKFLNENDIRSKIKIDELTVFTDATMQNTDFMRSIQASCHVSLGDTYVPMLYSGDEGKCYVGEKRVLEYFRSALKI